MRSNSWVFVLNLAARFFPRLVLAVIASLAAVSPAAFGQQATPDPGNRKILPMRYPKKTLILSWNCKRRCPAQETIGPQWSGI